MNNRHTKLKRPKSVTVAGLLFMITGSAGLLYHGSDVISKRSLDPDILWVVFVRLLALVCGFFLLRGSNWARGLLIAWMAYHVFLSISHTPVELIIHIALFAGIAFVLFNPKTSAYFQGVT